MGTTIVYAVMLMVAILLTDIITSFVDPRVPSEVKESIMEEKQLFKLVGAGNTESQEN